MSMIHEITPFVIPNRHRTRKGRGESSGHGKTSGRGNKGAKARQGTYIKRGHEGGQTPLFRRIPKRGFSNHDFARRFHIVNLVDLNDFPEGTTIDTVGMRAAGLIPNDRWPAKILGNGELTHKLTVQAAWFSKSAHAKIIAAGGSALNTLGQPFEFPKPKKKFIPRVPVKKAKVEEPAGAEEAKAPAKAEKPAEAKPAEAKPVGEAPANS